MKNLKKVLALVLVVVMALGLITVSNAAFSDEATIEKKEAVDVLTAIGVINGQPDGSFQPEGDVTRAQMAKMIAIVMNEGKDEVNDLYKDACKFTDSTSNWAAGYIAYCAQAGIINGKSETIFDPDGKVTGTEAAKMLLCALNYDAKSEGFVGANWASAVLAKAAEAKLIGSDYNLTATMNAPLDRQNAAQMILNALKADTVKYKNKGIAIVTDQITINTGAETEVVTVDADDDTAGRYNRIGTATKTDGSKTLRIVQLGEAKFPKLEKLATDVDAFGRPAHVWQYDSKEVTRAAEEPTLTYKDTVKGSELYNALGKVTWAAANTVNYTVPTGVTALPPAYDVVGANYKVKYYIDGTEVFGTQVTWTEISDAAGGAFNGTVEAGDVWTGTIALNATAAVSSLTPNQQAAAGYSSPVALITATNNHNFGRVGDKIEIYKDIDKKLITIVQTNYYTALIDSVVAPKATVAGYITLDAATNFTGNTAVAPHMDENQFRAQLSYGTTAFTADDVGARVIYTVGRGTSSNNTANSLIIQSVEKAETATGLFTSSVAGSNGADYDSVIIAGTTYKTVYNVTALDQNQEVTAYLDPNGNVIALDGESSKDYAYLMFINANVQSGIETTTMGRILFADGTVKDAPIKVKLVGQTNFAAPNANTKAAGADRLYTYKLDSDGTTYKLEEIPTAAAAKRPTTSNAAALLNYGANINKLNYFNAVGSVVTVDNSTKFIVETYDAGNDAPIYTTYEGVNNLPSIIASVAPTADNAAYATAWNYASSADLKGAGTQYAAVTLSGDTAASVVFIFGATVESKSTEVTALFMTDKDTKTTEGNVTYYTVDAFVNGAQTKLKVSEAFHNTYIETPVLEEALLVNNVFGLDNGCINSLGTAMTNRRAYHGFTYQVSTTTPYEFDKYLGTYDNGNIALLRTDNSTVDPFNVKSDIPVYVANKTEGTFETSTIAAYKPTGEVNVNGTTALTDDTHDLMVAIFADANLDTPTAFYVYEIND